MSEVYLDQNVLSQLRSRKRREKPSTAISSLYDLLSMKSRGIRLVYSSVHLDEIAQITQQAFVAEHIDLLSDLSALYIEPGTRRLVDVPPISVWASYRENVNDNDRLGINETYAAFEAIPRRLSGLTGAGRPDLVNALMNMIAEGERSLAALEKDGMAPAMDIENMRRVFSYLRAGAGNLPSLPDSPGPGPFRELDQVRALDIATLAPEKVIPALENIFGGALAHATGADREGTPLEDRISRCYTLLNWAGYSADDFTSEKKGRDRFRASNNDMRHTLHATAASFLVTEDAALLRKATACYMHVGIKTTVNTVEDFLTSQRYSLQTPE